MNLISITPSSNKSKKFTATFKYKDGSFKRIHFGQRGYSDYTLGATEKQRQAYRSRHRNDNLSKADTPGALSYYLLWGKSRSLKENLKAFNSKFNIIP